MAHSSPSRDISSGTDFGSARIRRDGPRATLFLGDVKSSAVGTSDPTYLEFEYMQYIDAAVSSLWSPQGRFRALHVDDVVCVLACVWSSSCPNSCHIAIEIDRLLAEQVRKYSPILGTPQVKIRAGGRHAVLNGAREGSSDAIVRDVFTSGVTLDHLYAVECVDRTRRALAAPGVYLVNRAHGSPTSVRQDVTALQEVFPFVASIQDPRVRRGRRRGNAVTLASVTDVVDADQIDRVLRTPALPVRVTGPVGLTC